jgi:cellulose synthase/poly-beta-1,6-N-acetylglucosamine synthase-like glycosyltransferase
MTTSYIYDACAGLQGLLAAATLPGTLEMLLVTTGALRRETFRPSYEPRLCRMAVVVPAHNEALLVGKCVASLSASARSAPCAIVVVADNCDDETAKLAKEAGARVIIRQDSERRGKGYALRAAFDQLLVDGFDAFLVIDADSVVSANLVGAALRRLNAGAGAVQTRYRACCDGTSLRAQLMDAAFLAFNVLRPKGRSGWGISAGILGNGFALRRETLDAVPYDASSIVEDLEYHLRLVSNWKHTEFIDEATVYGEMPSRDQAARVQRSRWEGGRLRMARLWVPRLVQGVVRGQWRMLEPLLELLTLPLTYFVLALFLTVLLPGSFRWYGATALGLIVTHVLIASMLGGNVWKTMRALAAAPLYIVWKLTTLDAVFSFSRGNARWVRTGRDQES